MPNNNPNAFFRDGLMTGEHRALLNSIFRQQLLGIATPVQALNPTAATDLITGIVKGGTLDTVGQSLEIYGAGITNLTTSTAGMTITIKLGGVTLCVLGPSGNITIGFNSIWNFTVTATVISVASSGAVTLEVHGGLNATLAALGGAVTTYNDQITAASSSVSAQFDQTLEIMGTISAGNAASFITQRQLAVYLDN